MRNNLLQRREKNVIVSLLRVHSVPLGGVTALLDVLMKAAVVIKSNGPCHLFSLTACISLGFTEMERSRPSRRLREE